MYLYSVVWAMHIVCVCVCVYVCVFIYIYGACVLLGSTLQIIWFHFLLPIVFMYCHCIIHNEYRYPPTCVQVYLLSCVELYSCGNIVLCMSDTMPS